MRWSVLAMTKFEVLQVKATMESKNLKEVQWLLTVLEVFLDEEE